PLRIRVPEFPGYRGVPGHRRRAGQPGRARAGGAKSGRAPAALGPGVEEEPAVRHNPKGEMPFLDHLEELRWRIFKAGAAFILCMFVGFTVVHYAHVTEILIKPAVPYLPEGKLAVFHPITPF